MLIYNRKVWVKVPLAIRHRVFYPDYNDVYNFILIRVGNSYIQKCRVWKLTENEVREYIWEQYNEDDRVHKCFDLFFNNI